MWCSRGPPYLSTTTLNNQAKNTLNQSRPTIKDTVQIAKPNGWKGHQAFGSHYRCTQSRDRKGRGDHGAAGSGNAALNHYAGQAEEYEQGDGQKHQEWQQGDTR